MAELNVQAFEALAKANEVRSAKAEDKRKIKRGELSASKVLLDAPPHWRSAKVIELILSMDYVGRRRADRWLELERIDAAKLIGSLTLRQRTMLARHLDVFAKSRDRFRRTVGGWA